VGETQAARSSVTILLHSQLPASGQRRRSSSASPVSIPRAQSSVGGPEQAHSHTGKPTRSHKRAPPGEVPPRPGRAGPVRAPADDLRMIRRGSSQASSPRATVKPISLRTQELAQNCCHSTCQDALMSRVLPGARVLDKTAARLAAGEFLSYRLRIGVGVRPRSCAFPCAACASDTP
jgi:hypothetical protein